MPSIRAGNAAYGGSTPLTEAHLGQQNAHDTPTLRALCPRCFVLLPRRSLRSRGARIREICGLIIVLCAAVLLWVFGLIVFTDDVSNGTYLSSATLNRQTIKTIDDEDPSNFLHEFYSNDHDSANNKQNASEKMEMGGRRGELSRTPYVGGPRYAEDALLVEAAEGCGSIGSVQKALRQYNRERKTMPSVWRKSEIITRDEDGLLAKLIESSGPLLRWVRSIRNIENARGRRKKRKLGGEKFGFRGHVVLLTHSQSDWLACNEVLGLLLRAADDARSRKISNVRDDTKGSMIGNGHFEDTKDPNKSDLNGTSLVMKALLSRFRLGARSLNADVKSKKSTERSANYDRDSGEWLINKYLRHEAPEEDVLLQLEHIDAELASRLDAVDLRTFVFSLHTLGNIELAPFSPLPLAARHQPSFRLYHAANKYFAEVDEAQRRKVTRLRILENKRRVSVDQSQAFGTWRSAVREDRASASAFEVSKDADPRVKYKYRRVGIVRPHDVRWGKDNPFRYVPLHKKAVFAVRAGPPPPRREELFLIHDVDDHSKKVNEDNGVRDYMLHVSNTKGKQTGYQKPRSSRRDNDEAVTDNEIVDSMTAAHHHWHTTASTLQGSIVDSFVAGSYPAMAFFLSSVVGAHESLMSAPPLVDVLLYTRAHLNGGGGGQRAVTIPFPFSGVTSCVLLMLQLPLVECDPKTKSIKSASSKLIDEDSEEEEEVSSLWTRLFGKLRSLWRFWSSSASSYCLPIPSNHADYLASFVMPLEPLDKFVAVTTIGARCDESAIGIIPTMEDEHLNSLRRAAVRSYFPSMMSPVMVDLLTGLVVSHKEKANNSKDIDREKKSKPPIALTVGTSLCSHGGLLEVSVLLPPTEPFPSMQTDKKHTRTTMNAPFSFSSSAFNFSVRTNELLRDKMRTVDGSIPHGGGYCYGPYSTSGGSLSLGRPSSSFSSSSSVFEEVPANIHRQLQLGFVVESTMLQALMTAVASKAFARTPLQQRFFGDDGVADDSDDHLDPRGRLAAKRRDDWGYAAVAWEHRSDAHKMASICLHYLPNHDCVLDLYGLMTEGERRMRLRRGEQKLALIRGMKFLKNTASGFDERAALGEDASGSVEEDLDAEVDDDYHDRFKRSAKSSVPSPRRAADFGRLSRFEEGGSLEFRGGVSEATRAVCPDGTLGITVNAMGLNISSSSIVLGDSDRLGHGRRPASEGEETGGGIGRLIESFLRHVSHPLCTTLILFVGPETDPVDVERIENHPSGALEVEVLSFSGSVVRSGGNTNTSKEKMSPQAVESVRDSWSPYTPRRLIEILKKTTKHYSSFRTSEEWASTSTPTQHLPSPPPPTSLSDDAHQRRSSSDSKDFAITFENSRDLFAEVMMRWLRTNNDRFTYVMSDVDPLRFIFVSDPLSRLVADVRAHDGLARDPHVIDEFDESASVGGRDKLALLRVADEEEVLRSAEEVKAMSKMIQEDALLLKKLLPPRGFPQETRASSLMLEERKGFQWAEEGDTKVSTIFSDGGNEREKAEDPTAVSAPFQINSIHGSTSPTATPAVEIEDRRRRLLRARPRDKLLLERLGPHAFFPSNFIAAVGTPVPLGARDAFGFYQRGSENGHTSARLLDVARVCGEDFEYASRIMGQGTFSSGNPFVSLAPSSDVGASSTTAMMVGTPIALTHYYRLAVAVLLAFDRDVPLPPKDEMAQSLRKGKKRNNKSVNGLWRQNSRALPRFELGVAKDGFLAAAKVANSPYQQTLFFFGLLQLAHFPHKVFVMRGGLAGIEAIPPSFSLSPRSSVESNDTPQQTFKSSSFAESQRDAMAHAASVRRRLRWAEDSSFNLNAHIYSRRSPRNSTNKRVVLRDCRGRRVAGILLPDQHPQRKNNITQQQNGQN